MQLFEARVLLMGGQACVLYGAAEYSRDLDLAVMVTPDALPNLTAALEALQAKVIAVPQFDVDLLERGHAVHFNVPDEQFAPLRVDLMSRMRGVDDFPALWNRRTSIALPNGHSGREVIVDVMALEDLVLAKKTQRDKDWPMIRRLVDASYASARDNAIASEQVDFWLAELRSPPFIHEVATLFPDAAARSTRPAVIAAITGDDVAEELNQEQVTEMSTDREYWMPLRRELEVLRHAARRESP